jgi:hypothetical protein
MKNSKKNLLDAKQDKDKSTRGFVVRQQFAPYFSPDEFPTYAAFFQSPGQTIKVERRTRVAIIPPREDPRHAGAGKTFVLKTYAYPFLPRIRTGFRISKAEQEFNGLLQLSKLGIPAVEPVAFGTERTRLGFVRSCFLITVFVDGAANLTACSSAVHGGEQTHGPSRASLTEQIAIQLRRAHERRFFLFTPKAKNVLVIETADKTAETIIVDIPYARSLCWSPLARWGQRRDIGVFLASLDPYATEEELGVFYQAYLPNPLGGSAAKLRRQGCKSMLAKQNRTLVTSLTKRFKRRWRNFLRGSGTAVVRNHLIFLVYALLLPNNTYDFWAIAVLLTCHG